MTRKRKTTQHGVGLEALYAAVILGAIRDTLSRDAGISTEAWWFLESAWCDDILSFLGFPDGATLCATLDEGIPPALIPLLGGVSHKEQQKRYEKKRPRRKKKKHPRPARSPQMVKQLPLLLC